MRRPLNPSSTSEPTPRKTPPAKQAIATRTLLVMMRGRHERPVCQRDIHVTLALRDPFGAGVGPLDHDLGEHVAARAPAAPA